MVGMECFAEFNFVGGNKARHERTAIPRRNEFGAKKTSKNYLDAHRPIFLG